MSAGAPNTSSMKNTREDFRAVRRTRGPGRLSKSGIHGPHRAVADGGKIIPAFRRRAFAGRGGFFLVITCTGITRPFRRVTLNLRGVVVERAFAASRPKA